MKNVLFAAFAVLGIVLGTAALTAPANALPAGYDSHASQAGGNG